MKKEHHYSLNITWTGNMGSGTTDYRAYSRDHVINIPGKPGIQASSDTAFRGDSSRYNPEDFLLASLSGCHMLWFLHLCADNGIVVVDYRDEPEGTMVETEGGGSFKEVILKPTVTVTENHMVDLLDTMHQKAHEYCFIANSVNFPVSHIGNYKVLDKG